MLAFKALGARKLPAPELDACERDGKRDNAIGGAK